MKLDSIGDWVRTGYSANITPEMDGAEVTLFGWVQEIRDLGAIRFIILQDREGTIQVTVLRKIESRSDARALDLCQEQSAAAFKIQHHALEAIRDFLFEKGFLEIHTPRIIASATEGGAELFAVNYFDQKAFLAQSPQLYKEHRE